VVIDPFSGAATTLLVADRLGRHGIGIELNPEYASMGRNRRVRATSRRARSATRTDSRNPGSAFCAISELLMR
jgi:site-specific DNA-methyltransferase (cytosine-N4-specific)